MSQFSIKLFKFKNAILVERFNADKSVTRELVVPDANGVFKIGTKMYRTHEVKQFRTTYNWFGFDRLIYKVFVNDLCPEVIDPLNVNHFEYTSEDFNSFMSSNVMKQYANSNKDNKPNIVTLLLLVTVGILAYFLYTYMQDYAALQDQLNQIIERFGGGVIE